MITRLPRWAWFGAGALAFVAGVVNVVGLLGFEHQAVTHLTGTTSLLATAVAAREPAMALRLLAVIGSFVAGCMLSGFLTKDRTLRIGRRHGAVLLLEALMLALCVPLLDRGHVLGVHAASFACGLQNAMMSAYSGALVRTTHLTGMFTDLGIFLGHRLRGVAVDGRRLRLCVVIIAGFLLGGLAGTVAYQRLGYAALYLPGALAAAAALACFRWGQGVSDEGGAP